MPCSWIQRPGYAHRERQGFKVHSKHFRLFTSPTIDFVASCPIEFHDNRTTSSHVGKDRVSGVTGHRSSEPGASIGLAHLGLTPLLELDLRLGEGTGAVLAVPLVQASARVLADMATFDSAGVTERDEQTP